MKALIAGLKAWPLHHEIEHFLGHALKADGVDVVFLGCSQDGMSACECVDRAIHQAHGGHRNFCAGCQAQQVGVHARAGFREIPMPGSEELERQLALRLKDLSPAELLDLPVVGTRIRDVAGASLMRWARSGRPLEQIDREVLASHAAQALRLEATLPQLLRVEGVDLVLVLNGLFLSERMISELARASGIRVVNYERGHSRNTLLFADDQPACFMEIGPNPDSSDSPCENPLLDAYLLGRAGNRDASTSFGTGVSHPGPAQDSRPTVAVLTNVCWDSSVSARSTVFGSYLGWLEAVLDLARRRPELDFALRVHPGEARLKLDPTLDRTEQWLAERSVPDNLRVIGAEDGLSTVTLCRQSAATVVFVTTAGLERACEGEAVVTCGRVHYAGKGFTIDCASAEDLESCLDQALESPVDDRRAQAAKHYAARLFLDTPVPFPWVDEVEYGRPQRVSAPPTPHSLAQDELLKGLVDYLVGRRPQAYSLRDLLETPALCPVPFHFGSRPASAPQLGVLITAHDRAQTLAQCLEAWSRQDVPLESFRILVVDDGSQPPLENALRECMHRMRLKGDAPQVELMRIEHCAGPAKARNAGLDHFAQALDAPTHVLITGDDMLPEPTVISVLQAELMAWSDPRVAVLGRVDWAGHLGHSRVMRLVERNGMQFGFHALPGRCRLPAQYFYTSSLCLPLPFMQAHGLRFAEDFPHAAWEDVEFGVRAQEAGMVLAYHSAIRFHHDHPTDYASFARRQRKAGASSRVFHARRPREHAAICGPIPQDPPDRLRLKGLEQALGELSKLELNPLRGVPGANGESLAAQLDKEQDRMLEHAFRMHSDAGWFAAPPLPEGPGIPGLLSVLIPVYGQAELTAKCLQALQAARGGPTEIIVLDNGSTDATQVLLKAHPEVRSLRVERNLGFARGSNLAAAISRGEFLVLLNNDTEVQPGWDLALRDELARPQSGAVGLRLLYPDGSVQHAGLAFGADGLPWHIYRGFPAEAPEVMQRRTLHAVTGACLGMRRKLWQQLGALDENYINCYEDVDLCLKVRAAGLEVVYRPDGCVIHHEGRTEGRSDRVTHSWLVLQESWAGRLPSDEAEILGRDGWEAVREHGTLRLRRISSAPAAQEALAQALDLLEQGKSQEARRHLERAVPFLNPQDSASVLALLKQLETPMPASSQGSGR